ncbi:hypothetical protein RB195_004486 [Necator americanus]|uniref:Uncharacterized protein n=1 Tax=Necator americanus TaxID=51031 RepID=A0ABR1BK07_NECAM
MQDVFDAGLLYTIISALATLSFACSSLICAQKKVNRKRVAGGMRAPDGARHDVSKISTLRGYDDLETALTPPHGPAPNGDGNGQDNNNNNNNNNEKEYRGDQKVTKTKMKSKDEMPASKPSSRKTAAEKKETGAQRKDKVAMDRRTVPEKNERFYFKTAEPAEFDDANKSLALAPEQSSGATDKSKFKTLEVQKTIGVEAENVDSERIDDRLRSTVQSSPNPASFIDTVKVDERLRSKMV